MVQGFIARSSSPSVFDNTLGISRDKLLQQTVDPIKIEKHVSTKIEVKHEKI